MTSSTPNEPPPAASRAPIRGIPAEVQKRRLGQHHELTRVLKYLPDPGGTFLDVGAYDGVTISNTYALELLGWTGLCVEANPELASLCARNRAAVTINAAAVGPELENSQVLLQPMSPDLSAYGALSDTRFHKKFVSSTTNAIPVPARTLTSIMAQVGITEVDFISIDIEGHEYDALRGAPADLWGTQVLLVEEQSRTRDKHVRDLANSAGLRFVTRVGPNAVYVRYTGRFLTFVDRVGHLQSLFARAARRAGRLVPLATARQ